MRTRQSVIRALEDSIERITERIGELSISCDKHNLQSHPEADACPCQAKLYWKLDRLDESVYRLKVLKHTIRSWRIWYIRSSTRMPGFPRESIRVWTQTGAPIAAWQKYGVAQRNGEVSVNHHRGFIYCKNGLESSTRPAASTGIQNA